MSMASGDSEMTEESELGHLRLQLADAESRRMEAESRLNEFTALVFSGQLTGTLPAGFLQPFLRLPDRPLEHIIRHLPAHDVLQMRFISHRFNELVQKSSKSMPKRSTGLGTTELMGQEDGDVVIRWWDEKQYRMMEKRQSIDDSPLSELLRFIHITGPLLLVFNKGFSTVDMVFKQLSKAWLAIEPTGVAFEGDLSDLSEETLMPFIRKIEPSITTLSFQNAAFIPNDLIDAQLISAAGQLEKLLIVRKIDGLDQSQTKIWTGMDEVVDAIGRDGGTKLPTVLALCGCSVVTSEAIRTFILKWAAEEDTEGTKHELILDSESGTVDSVKDLCAQLSQVSVTNSTFSGINLVSKGRTLDVRFGATFCSNHWVERPVDRAAYGSDMDSNDYYNAMHDNLDFDPDDYDYDVEEDQYDEFEDYDGEDFDDDDGL